MLFVLFKSLDSIFSVEASHTLEISRMVNITSLPSESGKINALVNYRGRTIPVLDVCKYLGNGEAQYNDESVIIIIEYKNQAVGLLTHDVIDMITVEESKIQEYKVLNSDYFNSAIQLGSTIVPILNPKKILLDVVDSMELMRAST